jgi:hypothetical protein
VTRPAVKEPFFFFFLFPLVFTQAGRTCIVFMSAASLCD